MTEQEMKETIMALQKDLQAKQQEQVKALAERTRRKEKPSSRRIKKRGVITMPSGLQYKILTDGKEVSQCNRYGDR
jgi:FKBP-type peptidyl-prolyl cis-trans isomerase FklB